MGNSFCMNGTKAETKVAGLGLIFTVARWFHNHCRL